MPFQQQTQVRMRQGLVLAAFVVGLIFLPAVHAAPGQGETQAEPAPDAGLQMDFEPTFSNSFDSYWWRYQDAVRRGDQQQKERALAEIRRLRVERNTFHLHDVAMSFAYRGSWLLAQGELDRAESSFQIARELDPNLPEAYHGLSQITRRSGGLGSLLWIAYASQMYSAALRSQVDGGFALADLLGWISVTLYALLAFYAALMIYRHGSLIRHDLEERFEERIGDLGVRAVTLAILLLPLMLTFGFGWLLPYWLVVTFVYQSWRERSISIAALVILLAAAPLFEFHAGWSRTQSNPLYRASISAVNGTFEPTHVLTLQRVLAAYPEDRDLQFLVGTLYKNLGEYEHAAARFRAILGRWPDDLAARVNLGNIYFALRDWEGAVIEYDRAVQNHPNSVVAYYNKSLALAENFQFREREAARGRAESLDGGAVTFFEQQTGDYRAAIDVRPDGGDIRGKFWDLEEGFHANPVSPAWIGAFVFGSGARFTFGALLLGFLMLIQGRSSQRRGTKHCRKCGSAFCGRCQIGTGRRGLCTQCYHLFFVKDGVSAQARNDKLSQVKAAGRKRGFVFRLLSVVAPGAGHIAEDMPLVGTALLLFWVGGVAALLMGGRPYSLPDDIMGLGSSLPEYSAVLVMVVVLVLANTVAQPRARG